MEIFTVTEKDIQTTSNFAKNVFIDYYIDLIGLDQATYMANLFLSEQAIANLMKDNAVFKIVKQDNQIIGFYEYKKEDERIFLSKLYVDKNYRHSKVGSFMFNDLCTIAKNEGVKSIYLTVNKHNIPSYNIYLHWGFKVINSVVNDIGNNYVMDDYIMEYYL